MYFNKIWRVEDEFKMFVNKSPNVFYNEQHYFLLPIFGIPIYFITKTKR